LKSPASLSSPLQQLDRTFVRFRGRKLTYFGGCDYFRLSSHPDVLRALHEGAEKFGLNVAASRITTGNHVLFEKLENELVRFFGVEDAALFSNGYATNLAFAQAFADEFTHAFIDARCHASPQDATQLLRCPVASFRHRDVPDLRRKMKSLVRNAKPLVLTDGLFAHDGSVAPVAEYLEVLPSRAHVLVDDAHGAGTVGRTGKGTPEVCGVRDERVVQTISLSKAFGVYGGAVLGARRIVERIRGRSRIFRGNTPLPLPLATAALASIRILKSDHSLRARLNENTARVKGALRAARLIIPENSSPIVAITPRTGEQGKRITAALLRAGIFPSLIRYADEQPKYFRFAISSEHTEQQLDALTDVLCRMSS
jgi:8-amino-7-oxononanoate synthase